MIIAYGYRLTKQDKQLISQMIKIVSSDKYEIYDLHTYTVTDTNEDTVFVFGNKAKELCTNIQSKYKLEFPDVNELSPAQRNTSRRKEIYEKLLRFKNNIISYNDTNTVISSESLPPVNFTTILAQSNSIKIIHGITKNGQSFAITKDVQSKNADINLTFSELCIIRAAMDLFKVEELNIVSQSNTIRPNPN